MSTMNHPSPATTPSRRKTVAKSLANAVNTELMAALLDRSTALDDATWTSLADRWTYDLYSRRPGPALLRDGEIKPTDLDLACFLSALAERKAIIQIPHYTSRRSTGAKKSSDINLSKDFRRGRLSGVTSNKEVFSFSIRMDDMSVMQASVDGGKLGAPRNFMILDVDGDWHEGWDQIDFVPTEKENAFIQQFALAVGSELAFDTFVHPNRWTSFYGEDYFVTKTAIDRAEQEATFLRAEIKRLASFAPPAGYKGPFSAAGSADAKDPRPTRDIAVTAFTAEVDVPFVGMFESAESSTDGYASVKEREHFLQQVVLPKLRFATRATEYAFWKHVQAKGMNSTPAWVKNAKWETGFRPAKSRTDWNRLVIAQIRPGSQGVALRFKTVTKVEKVTGR